MPRKKIAFSSKPQHPIADKMKEITANSVLKNKKGLPQVKKFPKNMPASDYVAIPRKKFKKMSKGKLFILPKE